MLLGPIVKITCRVRSAGRFMLGCPITHTTIWFGSRRVVLYEAEGFEPDSWLRMVYVGWAARTHYFYAQCPFRNR